MQETIDAILDEVRRAWSFKWAGLITAWTIAAIATVTILVLPDRYTSSARVGISLNDGEVPQRIATAEATFVNDATLDAILDKIDFGINLKSRASREHAKEILRARVLLTGQGSDTFTISYTDTVPERARAVSDQLLAAFLGVATDSTSDQKLIASLQDNLSTQETALAKATKDVEDYRRAHLDVLGGDGIEARLDAARTELDKSKSDYQASVRLRDQLQADWRINPSQTDNTSSSMSLSLPITDPLIDQLNTAYAQLRDLRTQYSEQYPDVILARKQVESIFLRYPPSLRMCSSGSTASAPAAALPAPSSAGDAASSDQTINQTTVINQTAVNVVAANIAVCRANANLTEAQNDFDRLSAVASTAFPIEQKLRNLTGTSDAITAKINDLKSKLSDATGESGKSVSIIQAPVVPTSPASPNRGVLLLATLLGSLGAGVAMAYVGGLLANTFAREVELERTFGLPVYGSVSKVSSLRTQIDQTAHNLTFLVAVTVLVAMLLALIIANPLIVAARQWAEGTVRPLSIMEHLK
ncbi:MAG: hypothetical protein WAW96_10190 [Alphaproteobacteria bacterium]